MYQNLVYLIKPEDHSPERLKTILTSHPEIRFVSLVGVDLGGNDTDEKIPIKLFLKDINKFLKGGIQTDGSSVVLPHIATLNDGKVDFEADLNVNWYVDYNWEHIDPETQLPVGTLRIPSFLIHSGERIDSRSVLLRAMDRVQRLLPELLRAFPEVAQAHGIHPDQIVEVILTAATELEFWVKTPMRKQRLNSSPPPKSCRSNTGSARRAWSVLPWSIP